MEIGHPAADGLIDAIYGGVLSEASWNRFLDTLAATIPGSTAGLILHDESEAKAPLALMSKSFPSSAATAYNAYYAAINPLPRLLSRNRSDCGLADVQLISFADFTKSEFFNDFLMPNELGFSAGVRMSNKDDRTIMLGVNAPFGSPANERVTGLLTWLGPHVRRAFDFYRELGSGLAGPGVSGSIPDAIGIGTIVLGEGGRVKAVSAAMNAMLREASPIWLSPLGSVQLRCELAQGILDSMLKKNYTGPKVKSLFCKCSKLTLVRFEKDRVLLDLEGPSVALLLESCDARPTFDLHHFALAYDLTKAEIRALSGIVEGKSAAQIAQNAFVSPETVRSQMKSLYAKTGTNSAKDVLRMSLLHSRNVETNDKGS